jgi:hypothetical protein
MDASQRCLQWKAAEIDIAEAGEDDNDRTAHPLP